MVTWVIVTPFYASYVVGIPAWRPAGKHNGDKRTRHPLTTPDGTVYSAEGKAEVFADYNEEQFTVQGDFLS